ncbi:hypothetical protein GCM10009660_05240 [Catellatospora bangladeshensis]
MAATALLREHLPELRVRVVNVVDLMRLQPETEHPHGMPDHEFDALFTPDKPVIFAYHGYPWPIHRLTYRRANHHNIHVRGYKEEGTTTSAGTTPSPAPAWRTARGAERTGGAREGRRAASGGIAVL